MTAARSNDSKELEALIKVCTSVNKHLELDDLLKAVMDAATETMKVETSSLAIQDPTTGELTFHTAVGEGEGKIEHIQIEKGEGIVGWVTETGKPAIVNDAKNDERFCQKVDHESGFETRSILCVPLKTPKRKLGAIEVINTIDKREFTEADLELCEAIAGQAAIAIENSLLHEDIVKHERMAAIGQTISSLAHCIKNVLHGIEGGSYMINTGFQKDDMKRLTRGWEIVSKNNAFMEELVLDMLNYAKKREPELALCNLNNVTHDVCEIVAEKATQKGVEVVCNPNSELEQVAIDPKGIKRCILNLISNGIDACEKSADKKAVTVSLDRGSNGSFTIDVSDTGCGIPEDAQDNLFKMFFSTKGSKGTGLGLAVTKKIIEEHGGDIAFKSECDKGTTFTITLPFKDTIPA